MGPGVLAVTDFTLTETILIGLVVALGIGFACWFVAGYYERRGGFGKK